MSQSAKAQEPSMEEILASIRRIIADEEPAKAAAPPPPRPAAVPPPENSQIGLDAARESAVARDAQDVLDLTESMAASPATGPSFQTIDGKPDVIFSDAPAPEPAPRVHDEPRRHHAPAHAAPDRGLISTNTSAAVDSAFNTLAQTVLVQNARMLEDLVREMLRPMLKGWLDDNLPGIVERLVKLEIERVSRSRS